MAEQAQVDVHALQMEYAQELINEEYIGAPPRNTQRMEHTLHPDVETGDSGNVHDGTRAHNNCVTCRSIGGLRMADVESHHSVH